MTKKVTMSFSLQPSVVEEFRTLAEELQESHSSLLDTFLVHILNGFSRAKHIEDPKEFEEEREGLRSSFTASTTGASYNLVLKLDVVKIKTGE